MATAVLQCKHSPRCSSACCFCYNCKNQSHAKSDLKAIKLIYYPKTLKQFYVSQLNKFLVHMVPPDTFILKPVYDADYRRQFPAGLTLALQTGHKMGHKTLQNCFASMQLLYDFQISNFLTIAKHTKFPISFVENFIHLQWISF